MRTGQKRTKWKHNWSSIVMNDNLGRRLSSFWLYWFPSQFLAGPSQLVIAPFHSLLYQSCEKLSSLCCQLQKEKLGQQLLQREKTLLSEAVSSFLPSSFSPWLWCGNHELCTSLCHFYGMPGPASGLLSCSRKITLLSKTPETF